MRRGLAVGCLVLALLVAGCSGGSGGSGGYGGDGGDGGGTTTSVAGLKTADSSLGTIVVTDGGMTAYRFDEDTEGATENACTSTVCKANWTPIVTEEGTPTAEDVTGEIATIPASGGAKQITIDGWPLYTYNGDSAAGDVEGQGVEGTWWVVDPAGAKIQK